MKAHDELLYWASVNHHPLYERYLMETYEEEHGPHFNEAYARGAVSRMHSTDSAGVKRYGEHWPIDQVKASIAAYEQKMHDEDTCWDAYVLLNMWYHDMSCNYKKHGRSDAELIEDAMTWGMCDEDAPDGKVWKYIHAMD